MAYLSRKEVKKIGFSRLGDNVFISDKASIYNPSNIAIGNNVRIDDFTVLSAGAGGIELGSYIHVAVFSSLIGTGKITLSDFCNLSSRVSVYSSSDDYSGSSLTNPMIPERYKNVEVGDVTFGKHVIVGSGSIILPGVTIGEGAAVGALSLVRQNVDSFVVVMGVPAKFLKKRSKGILKLEQEFFRSL